jgi:methionine-rich copper-binding protein CopC
MVAALIAPASAFAHEDLTASNPAPNSVSPTAVTQVVLTFSAPVILVQPGVVVNDGKRDIATTSTIADKTVTSVLSTPIGAGTYDVTWNIKGSDGHEVTASYSFSIAAGVAAPAAGTTETSAPNPTNTIEGATTATSNPLIQPRGGDEPTTTTTTAKKKPDTVSVPNWALYAIAAVVIVGLAAAIGGIVRLIRKRRG